MQLSLPKSPATKPSLRPDHHDTSLARRFGPVAALLAFCKSLDVGRLSSFALTHTPFPRFNRAGPENAAHCRGSGPAGRFVRLPTTSRPLLQRSERPFSHALPCPRTASSSRRDEERTSEMRPNLRGHPCQPVSPRPRSPRLALARRTRAHGSSLNAHRHPSSFCQPRPESPRQGVCSPLSLSSAARNGTTRPDSFPSVAPSVDRCV